MQATELARERDSLNQQVDGLRNELTVAKREVVNVRQSIVEEKQSLEHRLEDGPQASGVTSRMRRYVVTLLGRIDCAARFSVRTPARGR